MENCVFCKIVSGELPATKLYENDQVFVFLDIAPVNIGHSLVIPKKHFKNIYDTPDEILGEMVKVAQKLSRAIKSLPADGVNVTMNNELAAGQIVFHSHIHVIPRLVSDGFGTWKGHRPYREGEQNSVAEKIIKALNF